MTSRIMQPGIYADFDEASYFADPAPAPSLTQSIAKILIEKSPAHARLEHPRLAPPVTEDEPAEKYDAAKAIGNAAHKLILGRGRPMAVAEFKDFTTKAAKEFRTEQEAAGKLVILAKHMARADELAREARPQLAAAGHGDAFIGGQAEVMLAWREGDLWFRSLVDWMGDASRIYDLKTGGLSSAPHVVQERPSTDGWDIQAAMIERGLDVLDPDGAGRRQFHFVAVENEAPYALTVVRISEADMTMGRKKLAYAIDVWARCTATGEWPRYRAETVISRPRGYLETKWLERETEHEERKQREPMLTSLAGG